ncbi:MAG: hypothetical protein QOC70_82 [Verrucomicrobiota bacterium]|jgi:hypothetical protein
MATKKTGKRRPVVGECPNPDKAYTLWELVGKLQDRAFARFFFNLLKSAEANDPEAIACVNSYLAPTELELQDLGIPPSQIGNFRRCTDSGLLVLVLAKQNS